MNEETVAVLRTHPKVLFPTVILQVLLVAAHLALSHFWPASTGFALLDEWGQLAGHGIIVLVELIYVVFPLMRWFNHTFVITTRCVREHWGVLYKNAREVPFDRIVSINTERGILDRIFGCGTLVFLDASAASVHEQSVFTQRSGNPVSGIRFTDVPRVHRVRTLIDEHRFAGA